MKAGFWCHAYTLLGSLLLAGCALQAPRSAAPAADGWATHRDALQARAGFLLEGRAAVQKENTGGGSLKVRWRETPEATELRLVAPLAQGTYQLSRRDAEVSLTTADGARYQAASLEELMSTHLRWAFPVAGARYWVRGVPDPAAPVDNLHLDDEGLLRDLAQAGWRISVLEYQAVGADKLPRRLFMTAGDIQMRLVIDRWEWL